ncbi:hypothetical protein QOZ80_2AG0124410 [Eleusine coracana subsp. coracana]|nr:hypothetical protein QOZ80_2AG0124410 [Eleusine coracana subsp. coracana]
MAAKSNSMSQDFLQRFWTTLSYACSELCLIVLLHVAAVASYAATRVAGICRLKAPCILCSRLDHALHGKPWFSVDLVCSAHRLEISSLAYCKSHNQLAHSEDFCKGCLLGCTGSVDNSALCVSEDMRSRSRLRSVRLCSCCSEPFKNTRSARKLSENANAVESSYDVHRVEETQSPNQIDASDNTLVMTPIVVSGQVPADHLNEKTFVVGIEEVDESDGSPGRDENYKENGTSANSGTSKLLSNRSAAPSRIFVDRNSSVKNAFIGRLNLPSPRPSEIIFARDNNSTTQQEVKALLSQISSRGLDSSSSEGTPSPGINVQLDESNVTGRRPSLERSYSVLEPSDVNLVGDIEGESSVKNLKKQLELSKNSLAALFKELEEERSASAVAASQTMAMINRLQEEKAAMQMEALQYLRMMEEQADHDHEAIQNLHDLLTDRERELLDLDAELENCRRLLQSEPLDAGRFDGTHTMNSTGDGTNVAFELSNGTDFMGNTMSYFEDEKAFIFESLSRLEENICISTSRLASDDDNSSQGDLLLEDLTRADGRCMENSQWDGQDSPMGKERLGGGLTFFQKHDENECSFSASENNKMNDVPSVKSAILLLNARLKALEVDQKFLKKVLSSLTCGSDGLQCVQEVTSHLAELRRVVTQRRAIALFGHEFFSCRNQQAGNGALVSAYFRQCYMIES